MSVHFAFPNVNPDFIGCGRYLASDAPFPGYRNPTSTVIYQEIVEEAARNLASAPDEPGREIFEKKDCPDEKYAGSSLHLAYLLALIQRCRQVKEGFSGGIWCTGQIVISKNGQPLLRDVERKGFEKKLHAFIEHTASQEDLLFLVPAAHLHSRQAYFERNQDAMLSLEELHARAGQPLTQKTIVSVRPDELSRVISVLFELGPNPYKGLEAFDENDAGRFFGREEQVDAIWETFLSFFDRERQPPSSPNVLAILGASGSGKSSVARAGFLARLRRESDSGSHPKHLPLVFKPGEEPIRHLVEYVVRQTGGSGRHSGLSEKYEERIRRSADGLSLLLRHCAEIPVLILIDQFEEIYSPYVTEHERKQFIANLLFAASEREKRASVAIVVRTDVLSRTRQYPDLDRAIAEHSVIIPAMTRAHLQQAIQEPAKRSGYVFQQELLDELIAATEDNDGALPLLQFALTRIWEGLRSGIPPQDSLRKIYGVGGALADKAEQLYASLSKDEQRIARRAFLKLIHIDGKMLRYSRRRVNIADIVAQGESLGRVRQVLNYFSQAEARFITLRDDDGHETAEVTHEALFSHWERLAAWLEVGWEDLRFERRLEKSARRWEEAGRPDELLWRSFELKSAGDFYQRCWTDMSPGQVFFFESSERRQRNLRRIRWTAVSSLIVLTLVSIIGGSWAFYERQRGERFRRIAETNSVVALNVLASAQFRAHDELGALLTIMKAGKTLHYSRLAPELRQQVTNNFRELFARVRERNRLQTSEMVQALSPVFTVAFNSSTIASGHADGNIRLWDARNGALLRTILAHSASILSLAFNPQNGVLASASFDGNIKLWDSEEGREIRTLQGHNGFIYSVAFSPDGRLLASGSDDRTIKIWDAADGSERQTLRGHDGFIYSVAFSPDGMRLASGSDDRTIKIWDIAAASEIRTLHTQSAFVYSVDFSPDGKLLAAGTHDSQITIWETQNGSELLTLKGHSNSVRSVQFHPAGLMLASGSLDNTVKLWSLESASMLADFQGHSDEIYQIGFAPDGSSLISAGRDGILHVWETAKQHINPESPEELIGAGCEWIRSYLSSNPSVSPADRRLCE